MFTNFALYLCALNDSIITVIITTIAIVTHLIVSDNDRASGFPPKAFNQKKNAFDKCGNFFHGRHQQCARR